MPWDPLLQQMSKSAPAGTPTPPMGPAGGDLAGTYPNPTVAKINGSLLGTTTPASGRLLIGSGAAWQSVAMGGDATISAGGILTLSNTGVTPGTYGNGTNVASFTVNAEGRLTFAGNVPITFPASTSSAIVPGPPGEDGEEGMPGPPGTAGTAGATGATGAIGPAGDIGPHFIFATQGLGQTHDIGYIVGQHHQLNNGTLSAYTFPGAHQIVAFPHYETRGGLLRSINAEVTTSAGIGTKQFRIGIYLADLAGSIYPNTLFYDSGNLSNSTTGIRTVTASMPTLVAGQLYWFVIHDADGLAAYRAVNSAGIYVGIDMEGATTLTAIVHGYLQTPGAFGALPNPWGTTLTTNIGNTVYPEIVITYAS